MEHTFQSGKENKFYTHWKHSSKDKLKKIHHWKSGTQTCKITSRTITHTSLRTGLMNFLN